MSFLDRREADTAIVAVKYDDSLKQIMSIMTMAIMVLTISLQGTTQSDIHLFASRLVNRFSFGEPITQKLESTTFRDWDLDTFVAAYFNAKHTDDWTIDQSLHGSAPSGINPLNKQGVYLTASSANNDSLLEYAFTRLEERGGNAIIFDVKGSQVYFKTDSQLAKDYNLIRPIYDLPALVKKARQRGFYSMARVIAVKDPVFSKTVPEAQIRHPETNRSVGSVWVDPAHPLTLAYNRQVIEDIVASGIDEINLDYIRYPTEYSQYSIGITGQQKADKIERFILMVRDVIEEQKADTILGISTFAILGWDFPINFEPLGQDIARFAPYVDVISPMAYPSTFSRSGYYNPSKHPISRNYWLVYNTLMGYRELLGEEYAHKLRPWIQGYFMQPKGLRDQIQAVYDSGACGYTVWSAQNYYEPLYSAMNDIKQPDHCLY